MAATPTPEQQADSPAAVLTAVREARAAADREEVRILELALDWAAIHGPGDLEALGFERGVLVAGGGTPEVECRAVAAELYALAPRQLPLGLVSA